VQLPLTCLADDVATVKRAIALEDGPVLLAGLCVPKIRFGVDAASGRRKLAS